MNGYFCNYRRQQGFISMPELHRHQECHEIYYLAQGERRFFVENDLHLLKPGSFIFVPAGMLHRTTFVNDAIHARYYAMLPAAWFEDFGDMLSKSFVVSDGDDLEVDFAELLREYEKDDELSKMAFKAICSTILVKALRLQSEKKEMSTVSKAVDFIKKNLSKPLQLEDIAHSMSLSPNYFSTLFHSSTGMTVVDYLKLARIHKATGLLERGNYSVSEVAAMCGFSDPGYFSVVFRSIMKTTPSVYRRKYRNSAE